MQRENIDFEKNFVFVVKFMSYKVIFVMIIIFNLKLNQINIKIVFLYDDVEKIIYVYQFQKYKNDIDKVYYFKKTFYGLKQSF